ncbi:DNA-binding transcriptional regulator, LysR family [Aliiroseovarius sediminilitoris]|uniref:DNA-binding transcriptional regulator, LysR family n=1 Tax=Aliiroseovarius sediminilitoris TaxID=1173584 RepID=A0A1I0P9H3_9RHOB|nr:LysR family transcriptional regulator [Aliiroseovarius sediminilitoris]SEW11038.1 DNA-binding transcriptional regulator, LysR family [Aliiroseovarius sediminilitoris]
MHNENWDDLRYVLAVAETGSVLQAAKRLGVNHATVLRHLAAFEDRHGLPVFERTPNGYRVLADREHIIRAAQTAAAAINEVARLAGGGERGAMKGTVRITSTDTLCALVLPRITRAINSDSQDLNMTLLSSNTHLDLIREQAHIIVRPSLTIADDLVGVAACEIGFAAYATDNTNGEWLGLSGPLTRSVVGAWMAENIGPEHLTTASDSFLTLAALAAMGAGVAMLPCFVGDLHRDLVRQKSKAPHLRSPLWVARHVDTIQTAPMREVEGQLSDRLARQRDSLLG